MQDIILTDTKITPETDVNYSTTIEQTEKTLSESENFFRGLNGAYIAAGTVDGISALASEIKALPIGGTYVFKLAGFMAWDVVVCKSSTGSIDIYFADMAGIATAIAAGNAISSLIKCGMGAAGLATTGILPLALTFAVTTYAGYVITTEAYNWGSYVANYKENFYIYHDIAKNQDGLVIKYNTTDIESIKTQLNKSGFLGFEKDIDLIIEDGSGKRYEVIREDEYNEILAELDRRGFVDPTYLGADIHELFKDNVGLEQQWSDGYSGVIDMIWDKINIFDEVTNKKYLLLDKEILFPINGDAAANEIHIDDEGRVSGGAAGNDIIIGGNGNDTIYGYNNLPEWQLPVSDNDFIVGGGGDDTIYGNIGNDTIYGDNPEYYLTLDGRAIIPVAIEENGNNYLEGNVGNDYLVGGAGNDTIIGGADGDYLEGGSGSNILEGGAGSDIYVISGGNNTITDFDGEGFIALKGSRDSYSFIFGPSTKVSEGYYTGGGNEYWWDGNAGSTVTIQLADGSITTINNFTNGDLNLHFPDKPEPPKPCPGFGGIAGPFHTAENTPALRGPDPIVFDLNGDGLTTTTLENGTYFDHNNDGFAEQSSWVDSQDGILAVDTNSNGLIDNNSELVVDLSAYDTNSDGVIDSNDTNFADLKILKGDSTLQTLTEAGIASINNTTTATNITDENGNTQLWTGTYTKTDSTTGVIGDYEFQTNTAYSVATEYYKLKKVA